MCVCVCARALPPGERERLNFLRPVTLNQFLYRDVLSIKSTTIIFQLCERAIDMIIDQTGHLEHIN